MDNIDWDYAAKKEAEFRHDVMGHVHAFGHVCPKVGGDLQHLTTAGPSVVDMYTERGHVDGRCAVTFGVYPVMLELPSVMIDRIFRSQAKGSPLFAATWLAGLAQ